MSCGRDKFGNCRCKIVDSRVFPIWSLIHGSSWSGLIKAEPGVIRNTKLKYSETVLYISCDILYKIYGDIGVSLNDVSTCSWELWYSIYLYHFRYESMRRNLQRFPLHWFDSFPVRFAWLWFQRVNLFFSKKIISSRWLIAWCEIPSLFDPSCVTFCLQCLQF